MLSEASPDTGSPDTASPATASPVEGHAGAPVSPVGTGLARSARLVRLFRSEQSDPAHYYTVMAADAISQVAGYTEISGRTVVDVGGGPGWFTEAFRAAGARCALLELDPAELFKSGVPKAGAVLADGLRLPLRDDAVDIAFSSNVLEHVPDPQRMIAEMIRVTRPGGLIYLAFTNWYSPWGGHELSPWHFLGPGYAQRRYVRRYQHEPKHKVGQSLFPVHVGPVLRMVRKRGDIRVLDARPRYYPAWFRPILLVPGVREVVTWNLLLVLRKTEGKVSR